MQPRPWLLLCVSLHGVAAIVQAGAARKRLGAQRVAAARLGTGGMAGTRGVGHLHVLEAPSRIRKPSRERRGGSFGGSAKDAHGF